MKRQKIIVPLLAIFTLLVLGCKKDNVSETGNLTVRMTDQPGDYDTVNVEILEVQIHYAETEDDEADWVTLETVAGNYDLLLLQDGVTAILAEDQEVPVGHAEQMRLILGTNNYVVIDEDTFPLDLSSQDKTGLKFNLNTTIEPDEDVEVLFDFDAHKSIVVTGSGSYKLKPVIKTLEVLHL